MGKLLATYVYMLTFMETFLNTFLQTYKTFQRRFQGADPGLTIGGGLNLPRALARVKFYVLRPLLTSVPHTTC